MRKQKLSYRIFIIVLLTLFALAALLPFVYLVIGALSGGIGYGIGQMFSWWVAGIPYDLVHCVGNFTLMLVLYKPVHLAMTKVHFIFEKE